MNNALLNFLCTPTGIDVSLGVQTSCSLVLVLVSNHGGSNDSNFWAAFSGFGYRAGPGAGAGDRLFSSRLWLRASKGAIRYIIDVGIFSTEAFKPVARWDVWNSVGCRILRKVRSW